MKFKTLWNVLLVLILFLLFTSLFGFYISIRPPKIISGINPKDLGLDYEKVFFITTDGIKIAGWFIPSQAQKAKTIVLLHGYPADKGNILPALTFLNKKYNLLLFDFRYLGQSEGRYSTAGVKETEDLQAAINFLKSRGVSEVGVWGFSMGGAVALTTAARVPEIKAIVSESSYASLDLMTLELYRIPILKYPLAYLTGFWAKIFLSIDIKEVSPKEAVKNLKIPILIIHSKNDEIVSFKNALLIQDALKNNPKAEFWFSAKGGSPPKADAPREHASGGEIHGQFGEEYQKRIEYFFERNL